MPHSNAWAAISARRPPFYWAFFPVVAAFHPYFPYGLRHHVIFGPGQVGRVVLNMPSTFATYRRGGFVGDHAAHSASAIVQYPGVAFLRPFELGRAANSSSSVTESKSVKLEYG